MYAKEAVGLSAILGFSALAMGEGFESWACDPALVAVRISLFDSINLLHRTTFVFHRYQQTKPRE